MKVSEVRPLPGDVLHVRYEDGVEGEVDLSAYIGRGVFAAWNDTAFFETVYMSSHGSIAWSEEIELCRDSVYLKLTGKMSEDLFPRVSVAPS